LSFRQQPTPRELELLHAVVGLKAVKGTNIRIVKTSGKRDLLL
jgi:hypothetical protein